MRGIGSIGQPAAGRPRRFARIAWMGGSTAEMHQNGLEFEPANLAARRIRIILRIRHLGDKAPFRLAADTRDNNSAQAGGPSPPNADNVYYVR